MAVTRRAFLFGGVVIAASAAVGSLPALAGSTTTAQELDLFALEVGQGVTLTFPVFGISSESFLVARIIDDIEAGSRRLTFSRTEGRLVEVSVTVNR